MYVFIRLLTKKENKPDIVAKNQVRKKLVNAMIEIMGNDKNSSVWRAKLKAVYERIKDEPEVKVSKAGSKDSVRYVMVGKTHMLKIVGDAEISCMKKTKGNTNDMKEINAETLKEITFIDLTKDDEEEDGVESDDEEEDEEKEEESGG